MQRQTSDTVPPEPPAYRVVRVALPGTCGELVQGTLDGEPCLISCPIDYYSIAEVRFQPWGSWTVPEHAPKTRAPCRLAWLSRTDGKRRVRALADETAARRRGGSSTADIGATLYALGQAAGQGLVPSEVAGLAVHVEPTDSAALPWPGVMGSSLWPCL